jgi:two-component system CheB/CheR fusion protein
MRGVYLGGNDALVKTTGLRDLRDLIGKTDFDLPWPRGNAERYRADDQEVLATNRAKRHIIEPIKHVGGSDRWAETTKVPLVDPNGNACGVLGVAEDITERKAAEEALRREKALIEAIFDSAPGVIYLYDEHSRLVRWNAKAVEVSGFSDEELMNRIAGTGRPAEERERLRQAIHRVMRDGHGSIEASVVTRDGRLIPYYFTGVRVTLDGRPHLVGIGIDISERHRAEEQLRQALLAAEAANRAKDQFLAAASHELRTPLTPVLLLSSALEADGRVPPDARQDLAVIREHIEMEKRLIGDLLDFTAIHAGKLRMNAVPTDLNEVLHAAMRTCQKDVERKHLRLDVHLDARAHFTTGDPDRLRQVFWNLLQNAVKFTPDGGTIAVRTTDDGGVGGGSQSLRVEVADSGIGMDAETLQKLFRPFEQGPRKAFQHYGGLGLGLAISKTLVEAHGGSVSAMSPGHNQGSTFIVRLPATVTAAPEPQPPPRLPAAATPHLKLLLVEDHVLTLKTLQRLLAAEGHHVTPATTIAEAVRAAERERFDLVLSDVGLPDGSGCDLMPVLRDRFGLPGIALSGFGADGDLEASQRAGFLAHITKPVSLEAIRDALTRFAASRSQAPAPSP